MDGATQSTTGRAFAIGFWSNTGLALLKLVVGTLSGSVALVADGWHSLSDVLTNGGAWIAHGVSKAPPDEDHHYGHGNTEAVASTLIGAVLLAGGLGVAWSGLQAKAHLHEGAAGLAALWVAVFSIVANLGLVWVTDRAARAARSQGLRALARDNASDALASGLVLLAILGSRAGLEWAEPLAAVVIGGLIVFLGFRSVREGFDVLTDRIADPELRGRLTETAADVEGVRGVQRVRVHPLGAEVLVDMEVRVDGSLTVAQGHRIAHAVQAAVVERFAEVSEVHVHVDPDEAPAGAVR